jgi:hypothetical protein
MLLLVVVGALVGGARAGPGTYAHYQNYGPDSSPSATMEMDHVWVDMPTPSETDGNAVFASTQYGISSPKLVLYLAPVSRETSNCLARVPIGGADCHSVVAP